MNTLHKKPTPLYSTTARTPCPVCGHVSYSPAGIHPQCAMRAADKVQIDRDKARKLARTKPPVVTVGRYQKQCPRCRTIHHIRKQTCDCGHSFVFKGGDSKNS